jgi:uncharacterized protein with GYD domain
MPKFLFKISYSSEGLKGTLAEGFAKREAYIRDLASNMGLSVEALYWALGEDDAFIIFDGPSANAIAASLAATSAGTGKISTVTLLTAAEMDEAASKLPTYRAPGGG